MSDAVEVSDARVFAPMCADFVHPGHLNILKIGAEKGQVTVLLMTDQAMREYKRSPHFSYDQRREILLALTHVTEVIPCHGPHTYGDLVTQHKPAFFIHGSDWQTGVQSRAREQVIESLKQCGGQLLEPTYTSGVSSTGVHVAMKNDKERKSKNGVLMRAALNDLKRTPQIIAREQSVDEKMIAEIISGEGEEGSIADIQKLLAEKYPTSVRDIYADFDTSVDGVWVCTEAETRESARILDRKNANGETKPYYRYMDTACAAIAPFKPELIEELVYVADSNPLNPLVVLNKGHLLTQHTYFIGPVNFYYEVQGKRICVPMKTGDTALITPFVPHSFTSRDPVNPDTAKIVAVTYSGNVQRELPHLLHLKSACMIAAAGQRRNPASVRKQLLLRKLELRGMDEENLETHLLAEGVDYEAVAGVFEGKGDEHIWNLVAERMGEPGCFDVMPLLPNEEVVVQRDRVMHSSNIRCLARSRHLPDCGSIEITTTSEGLTVDSRFFQYMFNVGNTDIDCEWEGRTHKCGPSESLVVKPFVPMTLRGDKGVMYVVKVPGPVSTHVLGECSLFAQSGLDTMTTNTQAWW